MRAKTIFAGLFAGCVLLTSCATSVVTPVAPSPWVKVLDKSPTMGAVDGQNTVYTLSKTPATTPDVYLNGILEDDPGDYSLSSLVITFNIAPSGADGVKAVYFSAGQ